MPMNAACLVAPAVSVLSRSIGAIQQGEMSTVNVVPFCTWEQHKAPRRRSFAGVVRPVLATRDKTELRGHQHSKVHATHVKVVEVDDLCKGRDAHTAWGGPDAVT